MESCGESPDLKLILSENFHQITSNLLENDWIIWIPENPTTLTQHIITLCLAVCGIWKLQWVMDEFYGQSFYGLKIQDESNVGCQYWQNLTSARWLSSA